MTVIKSERSHHNVTPLALAPLRTPSPPQISEAEALREILAARDAQLSSERENAAGEREKAYSAGRAEGIAEGKRMAENANAILSGGVEHALKMIKSELNACESLSVAIAAHALQRVLEPSSAQRGLIEQIVKKQVSSLQSTAKLEIEVAQADFESVAQIEQLKASLKGRPAEIRASPSLQSGACLMRLNLGALEIGPAQQLSALMTGLSNLTGLKAPE